MSAIMPPNCSPACEVTDHNAADAPVLWRYACAVLPMAKARGFAA